jgi:hypothetical protein
MEQKWNTKNLGLDMNFFLACPSVALSLSSEVAEQGEEIAGGAGDARVQRLLSQILKADGQLRQGGGGGLRQRAPSVKAQPEPHNLTHTTGLHLCGFVAIDQRAQRK